MVLVDGADRSVAGVGERAGGEDGVGGVVDGEGRAIDVYKVHPRPLGFLLILFLIVVPGSPHHEGVVVAALGLLGVAVDHPSHLLVEDSVVNVGLFGVEVFVKRCPDDAVGVYGHSELLGNLGEVSIVPAVAPLV